MKTSPCPKLYTCPCCKSAPLSAAGLQRHRCPAQPVIRATTRDGRVRRCHPRLGPDLVETIIATTWQRHSYGRRWDLLFCLALMSEAEVAA